MPAPLRLSDGAEFRTTSFTCSAGEYAFPVDKIGSRGVANVICICAGPKANFLISVLTAARRHLDRRVIHRRRGLGHKSFHRF